MEPQSEPHHEAEDESAARYRRTVAGKESRKLRARRAGERGVWFWLGMFGLVGWSVTIPTLIGLALGIWADRAWPGRVSFTLTGLVLGAVAGCLTAWYWVRKESRDG